MLPFGLASVCLRVSRRTVPPFSSRPIMMPDPSSKPKDCGSSARATVWAGIASANAFVPASSGSAKGDAAKNAACVFESCLAALQPVAGPTFLDSESACLSSDCSESERTSM